MTIAPADSAGPAAGAGRSLLSDFARARGYAGEAFFASEADRIARLCHRMAERFARGGRLVAFGSSPAARSDVRHVTVEFVHPVIVGKRALPAIGLTAEGGALAAQVELVAESGDIAIAFGDVGRDPDTAAALALAHERGCMTIAFAPCEAEWVFRPPGDAFLSQEAVETTYHVLWELVHVFFEHRGLLEGRSAGPVHDSGASSFLYPFLAEQEDDLDAVMGDVRSSVLMKAAETTELKRAALLGDGGILTGAADELRACLHSGGRLLALGNGGSATDAMDVVADFRSPPDGMRPRRALDLTEDTAILTALANDIGVEAIFARQVIAHGRSGDMLLALSTSGGSANVISALAEARRRHLRTIAMLGYDGGRVAAEGLADHVLVVRSEHIPRIQEAHAAAYHALRALVELA